MTNYPKMIGMMFNDIVEFHEKFGLAPPPPEDGMDRELQAFRAKFLREEASEIIFALDEGNKVEHLDGLVDLCYVALGTLYLMNAGPTNYKDQVQGATIKATMASVCSITLLNDDQIIEMFTLNPGCLLMICDACIEECIIRGYNFAGAWKEVHAANMKKVRALRPDDSKRGTAYDVVKPDGWTPPDLSKFVGDSR